ncbi:MAG: hypothetical protein C7B43_02740 [Sulfobacillus benefaciens]|jgi:hypothetical protein|uniref:Uncharacterized protein n=1 Tax=Sulfobacillus benefaciens TaxID=453960 RepID=A0A2T2X9W4_9FIRM|nr:MAG: hypothetical protein C7B43_02740 [Sulfobacillus benefaciens]
MIFARTHPLVVRLADYNHIIECSTVRQTVKNFHFHLVKMAQAIWLSEGHRDQRIQIKPFWKRNAITTRASGRL